VSLRIDIVTVFPEMIAAALDYSILKRARDRGLVQTRVVALRDFTTDRHKSTDDVPYGGGGGMVMKIEPISRALQALTAEEVGSEATPARIVLTDPRGRQFTQEIAQQWAQEDHLILLCGHYEGVDERVRRHLVTDEISIGDYILTGGELPALVIVDALTRLQPGALGDAEAPNKDTFAENLLEYPQYTRPRAFNDWAVPEILLSGHHAQITRWRRWHQLRATQQQRPDLFARLRLSSQDIALLASEEPMAPPEKLRRRAEAPAADAPDAPLPERMATEPNDQTDEQEEPDGIRTGNDT
jgi:tRNA (guanine37-N1)-methyltransferase